MLARGERWDRTPVRENMPGEETGEAPRCVRGEGERSRRRNEKAKLKVNWKEEKRGRKRENEGRRNREELEYVIGRSCVEMVKE